MLSFFIIIGVVLIIVGIIAIVAGTSEGNSKVVLEGVAGLVIGGIFVFGRFFSNIL